MKILMLLSNPYIVDPRVSHEANALVSAGHKVTVIVWDRNHLYPSEATINGVRVVRFHNSWLMRILPHDLLRNPFWWMHAARKGVELFKNGFDFDVVHCHDLDTLSSGFFLKKKFNVKLVYDAHEIFGYMIEKDMPSFVVWFSFLMEKKLLKNVDDIITVDVGYASYFEESSDKPITIIRNCKDIITKEYIPPSNNKFSVVYIGTLAASRFFPDVLSVFEDIEDVQFIIAGKKEGLYDEVESLAKKLKNVTFLGTIPVTDVVPLTLKCHVVLCLFDPSIRMNQIGSPNKLFEAMVCGRPIIVTKGTHSGKIVDELQMGLSIDFSEESLKNAVRTLHDDPQLCKTYGRNALKAGLTEYNWPQQQKKLLDLYQKLKSK